MYCNKCSICSNIITTDILFDNISGLYMSEPGYNQIITKLPNNIKYARIFKIYKN
jgi:hypothetical protein